MSAQTMKAWTRERYGLDALQLRDVPRPEPAADGVVVRVRAVSVNPADWYAIQGSPLPARVQGGLRRPKSELVGVDFAGVVEAVGPDFEGLAVGDEVFGGRTGAFAEYVAVRVGVVPKPSRLGFEEAAAAPVAALTALQAVRDHGRVERGTRVLINGGSGGVGSFAVQVARMLGGHVTAVCSTRNTDLARSLGADEVVDYTVEDFTGRGERYDVVVDVAGSRPLRQLERVLAPDGSVVVAGVGRVRAGAVGPIGHIVRMRAASIVRRRRCVFFVSKLDRERLEELRALLESGQLKPVIDRRYGLDELPDALRYLGEGHARGKIVVSV